MFFRSNYSPSVQISAESFTCVLFLKFPQQNLQKRHITVVILDVGQTIRQLLLILMIDDADDAPLLQ